MKDTSDVYRNSTEEVVDEMTLRGRSVRKRPVVLYHRLAAPTSMVADPDVCWTRQFH